MVQLPAMWDITAPTARRQYDYRSDGIYFSGESGLREAAGVAVSAAVGARMGPWLTQWDARALAAQAPHLRATPRTASSTKRPATIQNMATWATSLGDVGPVLWSVVVCTIEGRGGEASQHVQKNIQGGGTKLM